MYPNRQFTIALIILVLLLAACAGAVTPAPPLLTALPGASTPAPMPDAAGSLYAITDVAIVDVENGITVPGQTVIVSGDRIARVGAQGEVSIPPDAEIIDGRGLYLMPGLADAHVHYSEAPLFGRVLIANGVLLVRDMGMPNDYILPLRNALNRGETTGPEMRAAGAMLDGDPPVIPNISIAIRTPKEGRTAVRAQAAAGADAIKVYSKLDKETFLAIVDEARASGLPVVGHVPDSVSIEDAAAAGMKSIEHFFGFEKRVGRLLGEPVRQTYSGSGAEAGFLMRLGEVDPQALQDFYRQLRASGVTVDPTIVTFKNWPNVDTLEAQNLPWGEYVSDNLESFWKTQWSGQTEMPDLIWQNWAQMVRDMNRAGVPLMVGTDLSVPGIVPGFAVHQEMTIWQEAGVPPTDILRSATLVPAQVMGLGNRLGSIRENKTASMVLVRANPLQDIKNAQQIQGVFLRGEYLDRQDLDRLLAEAKDLARTAP